MQLQVVNPQGIDPNEFLCNGSDNAPGARVVIGDQITGGEQSGLHLCPEICLGTAGYRCGIG
jgi:hypothetical protein